MLKELKWNSIITAVLFTILGFVLVIYPKTAAKTLFSIIGWILLLCGIVTILTYFFRPVESSFYRNDFVIGMIEIIIGLVMAMKTTAVTELVPVIFGIVVVISGFIKLQASIDLKRLGAPSQNSIIIMALINILFGCILIWAPFSAEILMTFIGISLIYSGITDLVLTIWLSTKYRQYLK
jgi:uncharacterized membrane protein HdeD (DUF308 family)